MLPEDVVELLRKPGAVGFGSACQQLVVHLYALQLVVQRLGDEDGNGLAEQEQGAGELIAATAVAGHSCGGGRALREADDQKLVSAHSERRVQRRVLSQGAVGVADSANLHGRKDERNGGGGQCMLGL